MPSSATGRQPLLLFLDDGSVVATSAMKSAVHAEDERFGSGTPFAVTSRRTLAHVRRDRAGDDR